MSWLLWFYGVVGIVIGSFLNVCIDRLPAGQSLIKTPSHCPDCQKRIRILDLVPVLSYLVLRGRCRHCGAAIPIRVLIVEILTGLVFILIWNQFGQSWQTLIFSIYSGLLIVISFIDLEHHKVLNMLVFPAIALALLTALGLHIDQIWNYLLGGLVGFAVLFLIAVLSPGSMGMGDAKLILFLGLISGYPEIILVLFLAFISGGLIAGTLLLIKKVNRKDPIAFGPYLALAGWIVLLYGNQILTWWSRMITL